MKTWHAVHSVITLALALLVIATISRIGQLNEQISRQVRTGTPAAWLERQNLALVESADVMYHSEKCIAQLYKGPGSWDGLVVVRDPADIIVVAAAMDDDEAKPFFDKFVEARKIRR